VSKDLFGLEWSKYFRLDLVPFLKSQPLILEDHEDEDLDSLQWNPHAMHLWKRFNGPRPSQPVSYHILKNLVFQLTLPSHPPATNSSRNLPSLPFSSKPGYKLQTPDRSAAIYLPDFRCYHQIISISLLTIELSEGDDFVSEPYFTCPAGGCLSLIDCNGMIINLHDHS